MDTDRVEFNDNSSEFITETSTDIECFDNESFTYRQEHEYRMLSKKMDFLQNFNMMDPSSVSRR